jgi:hypothetical protein
MLHRQFKACNLREVCIYDKIINAFKLGRNSDPFGVYRGGPTSMGMQGQPMHGG